MNRSYSLERFEGEKEVQKEETLSAKPRGVSREGLGVVCITRPGGPVRTV